MKYKIINLETKKEYELEASNTIEDAIDLVDEVEKEWPQKDAEYWCYQGEAFRSHTYYNDGLDEYYKRTNNIFKTREEAERYMKIFNTIHDLVEKYNKIEPLDWSNFKQNKYYLLYEYDLKESSIDITAFMKYQNVLYCTHNYLKELLTKISKDDLDWYTKR
jgi:hypothetical protein